MNTTKKLVFMGLFIALEIVLTRVVSLMPSTITRISLSFIVYSFSGLLFGPVFTGLMAMFGDLVGAILFPPPGGFMIGFTLSAMVAGVLFGFITKDTKRIILILILNLVIIEIFMNTYWLHILLDLPMMGLWIQRAPGILINFVLRLVVLIPLIKKVNLAGVYENRY